MFWGAKKSGDKLIQLELEEEDCKYLAGKIGFEFRDNVNDTLQLARELDSTLLERTDSENKYFLKNILAKSDYNGRSYLFYRTVYLGLSRSAAMDYTVYFYKANKDFGLNLNMADFVFQNVFKARGAKELNKIKFEGNDEFNKRFIVYSDKDDVAKQLINSNVMEYCLMHKEFFRRPVQIFMQILTDRLFIFAEHSGFKKDFAESKMMEFVNLAEGLKEKMLGR